VSLFVPSTATNMPEWVRKVATAVNELLRNSSTGSAIADGDKGDIVVSGSGTTWTIDPAYATGFASSGHTHIGLGHPGSATIDFGAFPGSNEASVSFADTSVLAGSNIQAWFAADSATADHTAADHRYAPIFIQLTALPTAGVGGTIYARSEHKMQGQWAVEYSWS